MDSCSNEFSAIQNATMMKKSEMDAPPFNLRHRENDKSCFSAFFHPTEVKDIQVWKHEANQKLASIIHSNDAVRSVMFNFFERLSKKLTNYAKDGWIKFVVKGSTPLKLWFDNNINMLPKNLAKMYREFSKDYLLPSDWDSDLIIDPNMDSSYLYYFRNILDIAILEEMIALKRRIETDTKLASFFKHVATTFRFSDGVQVSDMKLTKRNSFYISPQRNALTLFREVSVFDTVPITDPYVMYTDYESPHDQDEIEPDFVDELMQTYEHLSKKNNLVVTPKSHIYITRNCAIRGDTSFDLYRVLVCFSVRDDRTGAYHYLKGELIDVSIPTKGRAESWNKYTDLYTLNSVNFVSPTHVLKDLQHIVSETRTSKDFKLNKRIERLKMLKRLECHLGKQFDFESIVMNTKNMTSDDRVKYFVENERTFGKFCEDNGIEIRGCDLPKSEVITQMMEYILDHMYSGRYGFDYVRKLFVNSTFMKMFVNGSDYRANIFFSPFYLWFSNTELCNMLKHMHQSQLDLVDSIMFLEHAISEKKKIIEKKRGAGVLLEFDPRTYVPIANRTDNVKRRRLI